MNWKSVGRLRESFLQWIPPTQGIEFRSGLQLIVAPNGYGKSTFLQTIGGVLPPLKGKILLGTSDSKNGQGVLQPERDVLYVSEYLSFPKFLYPREWIGLVGQGNDPFGSITLEHAIDGFSMRQQMDSYLGRLSQGERRKVTWLGAHVSRKPVLLLDEPLDGLDLLAIRCARELVQAWRNEGRVVCVIAHQVGELLDLSDEVFLIRGTGLIRWKDAFGSDYRQMDPSSFRDALLEFYGKGQPSS